MNNDFRQDDEETGLGHDGNDPTSSPDRDHNSICGGVSSSEQINQESLQQQTEAMKKDPDNNEKEKAVVTETTTTSRKSFVDSLKNQQKNQNQPLRLLKIPYLQ